MRSRSSRVLPKDDPRLGEFAGEFGGMLGTIEERPTDGKGDAEGFAGASDVIDSDELLKVIEDTPDNQVDTRAFLTARLVDLFLGDWDRHRDQWRWARFGDERPRKWQPIPRDRDQAFVKLRRPAPDGGKKLGAATGQVRAGLSRHAGSHLERS